MSYIKSTELNLEVNKEKELIISPDIICGACSYVARHMGVAGVDNDTLKSLYNKMFSIICLVFLYNYRLEGVSVDFGDFIVDHDLRASDKVFSVKLKNLENLSFNEKLNDIISKDDKLVELSKMFEKHITNNIVEKTLEQQ
jgi:hypothetical protein